MNKYKNALSLIGKVLGFCLFGLMALGLAAAPIIVIIFLGSGLIGGMLLLFELCLCCAIHFVSYAMGLFFFGDHYKPTGYVNEGRSLNWPKATYMYVKRNMITNFIEINICALFSVLFVVLFSAKIKTVDNVINNKRDNRFIVYS